MALIGLLMLVATVALSPSAHAAEPAVTVNLTQAEVIDGRLRLAGNLTNTGTAPLRTLSVQLWRSRAPLSSRDAVEKALTEKTTTEGLLSRAASATLALTTGTGTLDPGQSSTFAVDATGTVVAKFAGPLISDAEVERPVAAMQAPARPLPTATTREP